MERATNPYTPPNEFSEQVEVASELEEQRGPLLYFAASCGLAVLVAIPLIVPRSYSVKDDPNPIGYLLILVSFPLGGLIYRIRSRHWPIDMTVRKRQIAGCCATVLLPLVTRISTGMRGQGFHMTVLSGFVSLILMSGIVISGRRRSRTRPG